MRPRDFIWTEPADALRAELVEMSILTAQAVALAGSDRARLSTVFDALSTHTPDCADRAWRRATFAASINFPRATRWKAKALGLNPDQKDIDVALSGMVPFKVGDKWMLGVAYPAPKPLSAPEPIDDLIIIDPEANSATLYGASDKLITGLDVDHITVHADAMHWARELATTRLEWLYMRRQARRVANIEPVWTGLATNALAIGDLHKIRWPMVDTITAAAGIDQKRLVAAVRRQFHLPRIQTRTEIRRAA